MKNHWLDRPNDDLKTLQELADENGTLTCIYPYQYVQGEVLESEPMFVRVDSFVMSHTPVLERTMTGTVYLYKNGVPQAIQTFVDLGNKFLFHPLTAVESKTKVIEGGVNKDGEIFFVWNDIPDKHYFVVNYEYEYGAG